ncbi:hypothetical protein Pdw03_5907 [Penicillium digitatum]|uniref:Uncharacterized protein n=1 Tax=Penicillium digitatum TaxID=36651 RepID=A0A7T6XWA3_PENDI|nr:hypothetical protein Pdw03_5907 [Penicillium digitatum]
MNNYRSWACADNKNIRFEAHSWKIFGIRVFRLKSCIKDWKLSSRDDQVPSLCQETTLQNNVDHRCSAV